MNGRGGLWPELVRDLVFAKSRHVVGRRRDACNGRLPSAPAEDRHTPACTWRSGSARFAAPQPRSSSVAGLGCCNRLAKEEADRFKLEVQFGSRVGGGSVGLSRSHTKSVGRLTS